MRLLGLFILMAGAATAGEYAVLANGARLHVDRHEADGAKVRVHDSSGFMELGSAVVIGYEAEESVAPAAVAMAAAPVSVVATEALTPLELGDAAADRYG